MAIANLDGVVAGWQPVQAFCKPFVATGSRMVSTWGIAGIPGAGSNNTTLNGGVYSSTSSPVAGQIFHADPAGGISSYAGRVQVGSSATGVSMQVWLVDRLWDNGGFDVTNTGVQSITSPTWPARDMDGSTNGRGVMLMLEVSATTGSGSPSITVTYTNSAGTASRTGANITSTATTTASQGFLIGLQAGDVGVRSVQSLQLSGSWTSGTINLVAFRWITPVGIVLNGAGADPITGGFGRLYNGSVPYFLVLNGNFAGSVNGTYVECQG